MPCLNCPSADVQDRYEILGSKKPGRYFHEHLIRAGENRDVKCKHCSEPSNTARQIGPGMIFFLEHCISILYGSMR